MSKTSTSRISGGLKQKQLPAILAVLALVIFSVTGWAWWHMLRSDPTRTFYAALENNFRTQSVYRSVVQENAGQKLDQKAALVVSPEAFARSQTTISQSGQVNATVQTETMSTLANEFVRYTKIDTDQKKADGKSLDFSQLVNIWGKSDAQGKEQPGELFGDTLLGVVPIAYLTPSQRSEMMKMIRDKGIYKFDNNKLTRKTENGRPVYEYELSVSPVEYVTMLKQFASYVGLKQLESVNPQQFASTQPLTFKMGVDVWSQRISKIEYQGGARKENFSGYGVNYKVETPSNTIALEELQQKLQSVQQ